MNYDEQTRVENSLLLGICIGAILGAIFLAYFGDRVL